MNVFVLKVMDVTDKSKKKQNKKNGIYNVDYH